MGISDEAFRSWFELIEQRHLSTLSFSEVRRAVQALSSLYVERRDRLNPGAALSGAGKRAAFAMFFAPLHFVLVREIIRALDARLPQNAVLADLGCGTGVAGAAWALEAAADLKVVGIDRSPWALRECKWNYEQLHVRGVTKTADLNTVRIPRDSAVVAAFTINELDPVERSRLQKEFTKISETGLPVLIIEPIARRLVSWWDDWARSWKAAGGREDQWRFRVALPERLALMDRAAGLDHRELTGRSLWLPGVA